MTLPPVETDHTFLNKTISSLTDQIDLFETFQDLSLKIVSCFGMENILTTFCAIVREVMPFQSAAIYLYTDTGNDFHKAYQTEEDTPALDTLPERSIINWVMAQGKWTVVTDRLEDQNADIISILPLKSPKHPLGFMMISTDPATVNYGHKLVSILNFLASQTAIAIENDNLYTRIQHANAYMADMIESISNGIMSVGMDGRISMINKNATAILGIRDKQIIGKPYSQVTGKHLTIKLDNLFTLISTRGFAAEIMVNHRPYREVDITVGITASCLRDRHGNTIGIIFIFRDMSASREIERLTRLDQIKSELVSNVSHELKTPLSIMKSYTEALLKQVEPNDLETRKSFLSVIDTQIDHLSLIVTNLLDLSRIESGSFTLDIRKISLKTVVHSVISVLKPKAAHIDIITDFEEDLPEIEADEEKIREVLMNLISNGIKFSPKGGIIQISVEKQDNHLSVTVSDTGIGIPEDKLPHIFEKFYRVDSSDTCEIEGTGLGLSIVQHIVESHNGSISVESSLGKGTAVMVRLPVTRS